jgi:hypothetical protein
METRNPSISPLRQRMIDDMRMRTPDPQSPFGPCAVPVAMQLERRLKAQEGLSFFHAKVGLP